MKYFELRVVFENMLIVNYVCEEMEIDNKHIVLRKTYQISESLSLEKNEVLPIIKNIYLGHVEINLNKVLYYSGKEREQYEQNTNDHNQNE